MIQQIELFSSEVDINNPHRFRSYLIYREKNNKECSLQSNSGHLLEPICCSTERDDSDNYVVLWSCSLTSTPPRATNSSFFINEDGSWLLRILEEKMVTYTWCVSEAGSLTLHYRTSIRPQCSYGLDTIWADAGTAGTAGSLPEREVGYKAAWLSEWLLYLALIKNWIR